MKSLVGKLAGWLMLLVSLNLAAGPAAAKQSSPRYRVLVFSKTAGFRHASIPAGIAAIQRLGQENDFAVEATEDAAIFNAGDLDRFDAVIFLSTTMDILDAAQQTAFEQYIAKNRGFVGIHAAADTEYEWPWYGELVGGYFQSHPQNQTADIRVADRTHPATRHLPQVWQRFDEWYNYRENPRGNVHVLMTLDETSYDAGEGAMGADHPISWAHHFGGGRAFYTGLGHTDESFAEPLLLQHILGAIDWAAGKAPADVGATESGSFEKTVLVEDVTDPIEMTIAPDSRVFFVERQGAIRVWNPDTEATSMVGFIPVDNTTENGMLGITLDPGFAQNGWMYVYYSPKGPQQVNRLSRLTIVGNQVQPGSQLDMLDVVTQREECCHTGGSLAFDREGDLYLSTGDNTNPFASDGFAPIDDRPGREPWDALRTAGNTNDLRGKILRIRPQADGSYTIPQGNLFPNGQGGRPEVFVMGNRNPYRISLDPQTGWLHWGEVGPDAGAPLEERGPAGHDEFNRAKQAGNFGWPMFVGNNKAYRRWDFESKTPGEPFDASRPVNDSRNNTGAEVLPPAQPAFLWYPYAPSEEFPELEVGGRTAMSGPVIRLEGEEGRHPQALPAYFDDTWLIYEWARNWIKEVKLDENGELVKINPLFQSHTFIRPMDMEIGPDGRLYVMEWGTEFWGMDPEARIVRMDYYGGPNRPPSVAISVEQATGARPMQVTFQAEVGDDTRAAGAEYTWDLDGDGQTDSSLPTGTFTFAQPGDYTARLTVTNAQGLSTVRTVPVVVGNAVPEVALTWPVHGGFFEYGEAIRYEVSATDPEDGTINPQAITVQPYLYRDTHVLALQPEYGTEGTFTVYPDDYEHITRQQIVVEAEYTDQGAEGADPATGRTSIVLNPRRVQAEFGTMLEGATRQFLGDMATRANWNFVVNAANGAVLRFDPVNLKNIESLTFRVKPELGGSIEVRQGSPDGRLLATVSVPAVDTTAVQAQANQTAGDVTTHDEEMHRLNQMDRAPEGWRDFTIPVQDPGGPMALFLVFKGAGGEGNLMALDWTQFNGAGVAAGR